MDSVSCRKVLQWASMATAALCTPGLAQAGKKARQVRRPLTVLSEERASHQKRLRKAV